ncbi:MAG: TetR/AcrR family transcriptional regulator [Thermoleophilaceae bacterium]
MSVIAEKLSTRVTTKRDTEPTPLALPVLGTPGRLRSDAARNAERILAAAERLFRSRGVENVSMDDIAAEAGVGKGTLFRRFGDRASLARAVISERERRFQEELIRGEPPLGPGAPARERLIAFGAALLDLLEQHGDLIRASEHGPWASSPVYTFYRTHVELLVREADPRADAEFLTDALLGLMTGTVFLYMRAEREMPLERVVVGYTDMVRRLLPDPA